MVRSLASVAILLLPCQVTGSAASTPAPGWQAQWIGPARVAEADLTGATWIWSDEPGLDATRNAKPGSRFFRRKIDIPSDGDISSAIAVFTADNRFNIIVNGKTLGGGSNWQQPRSIDLAGALQAGSNQIIIHAENDSDEGAINAAALIGKIRIELEGKPAQEIITDPAWESAEDLGASSWKPVKVVGPLGMQPWGEIKSGGSAQTNLWTCYRKKFALTEVPATAIARIAVDSKYWLWINGRLAIYEGGLKRGPTPRDTYLDRVDLAPYLQKGENTIAVLAWFWGKEGFSHKNSGKNGFVFELDAGATRITSDSTWKALRHPAFGRTGEPHPNYRMPDENVHFDARLDIGEWTAPGFDDASWKSPETFGTPPAAPWNQLIERPTPQWRRSELLAYENAAELPKTSDGQPIIARLPKNITISPYLKIKAPAGLTIDMRTDNYKGGSEYNYRSEYITKEGIQEFESMPYLNGHWMIYSIPAGVEILDLRYRETRYDTDYVGSFHCDDPFLNALWMKARNTMNINMRDSIQDPDRERAQWWGDIVILMNQILYTCDDRAVPLIRKAIDNLVDWQKPDGVLYSPIPAGSWDDELPMQMLLSIGEMGFWNYYIQTGDRSAIERSYPAISRYLALWTYDANGLAIHRAGGWDWGDWGENIDMPLMENALLYQAYNAAIQMARLTGNGADIPGYEAKRKSIEYNYNKTFWNGREYRSPGYTGKTDDRGHAMAVMFGLAKPDQWPAIKEVFAREFHSSPYMEKFALESLFRMDEPAAALARMKTRYAKMVESSLTTLWEGWGVGPEGYGGGSYNHGWAGGPLTLMHEYAAGIRPTSPGFATYTVKPQLGFLTEIICASHTVKGLVEVGIQRNEKAFQLKLISPNETVGTVYLPLKEYGHTAVRVNKQPLWLNGQPDGKIPGITPLGESDGWTRFRVEPGNWTFEAR